MKKRKKKKEAKTPPGLRAVDALCVLYVAARTDVADRVRLLQARRRKYTRRLIPGLRKRIGIQALVEKELLDALGESRDEFKRPKTRTLSGVKVGWRTPPPRLVIDDEERTIKLIRKRMSRKQQALLLQTTTKVVKSALKRLPAEDLAAVGCSLAESDDVPVLAAAKDGVDQLAAAFLAEHRGAE